jgi:hypothetical protein
MYLLRIFSRYSFNDCRLLMYFPKLQSEVRGSKQSMWFDSVFTIEYMLTLYFEHLNVFQKFNQQLDVCSKACQNQNLLTYNKPNDKNQLGLLILYFVQQFAQKKKKSNITEHTKAHLIRRQLRCVIDTLVDLQSTQMHRLYAAVNIQNISNSKL